MPRCLALLTLAVTIGCTPDARHREPSTVLFLTDFGVKDGAVAACKGVMWSITPDLRIVDLTHDVPPYDIETAAEVLEQALPFYPVGTVAVAVVDPEVGGDRKAVAIRTKKGHILVGPDNGIFTLVMQSEGVERAVELRDARYFRSEQPSVTFHGRDVFAPVAAHLAAGTPLDSLGPPIAPVMLDRRAARIVDGRIEGVVRYVEDPYGNVVTNIPAVLLDSVNTRVGDSLEVQLGSRTLRLPWRNTFSDVPPGQALAIMHSRGLLSFSVNQGDFASRFGVRRKHRLWIREIPSSPATPPLGVHRPAELTSAAEAVVGFLRGEVAFDRIRLAETVTLHVSPEGGGARNEVARERLRDLSNWKVRASDRPTARGWVHSFVPPRGKAELTTRVGRHFNCREYPLSSRSERLARLPHVGTMLMFDEAGGCLHSWNLTLVFDPKETPPTVVAVLYDQVEW